MDIRKSIQTNGYMMVAIIAYDPIHTVSAIEMFVHAQNVSITVQHIMHENLEREVCIMQFPDKKVVSEDAIKTLIGITKDELETQSNTISNIQTVVNGKQDALTAGTAISLASNVVGVKVGDGLTTDTNGNLKTTIVGEIMSETTYEQLSTKTADVYFTYD